MSKLSFVHLKFVFVIIGDFAEKDDDKVCLMW